MHAEVKYVQYVTQNQDLHNQSMTIFCEQG